MITLKVADYCHDCPGFEAEVDKDYRALHCFDLTTGRETLRRETTVTCKYRGRCEAIHNYIQKQIEKENAT